MVNSEPRSWIYVGEVFMIEISLYWDVCDIDRAGIERKVSSVFIMIITN